MNGDNGSGIILIAETAADTVRASARSAHPNETGGILLGVTADGKPWITQAIEIHSHDRGRRHYRLPYDRTHEAVHTARKADPRVGYLGEWHSHPADVGPSPIDRATMRRIAYLRQPWFGPVLIVVRRTSTGYDLDTRQVVFPLLRKRCLSLTGDLPEPEPAS
jgi:proteasome lid subunit RPN8/RPN11